MGDPPTAGQQQGDEQKRQTDDGIVRLRQASMQAIPQSAGQVECDQEQAYKLKTAERCEPLIFEAESAWRVDAAPEK
jgi:hypothetical protein